MNLSGNASQYLNTLSRDEPYTYSDKSKISEYFKTQNVPVFEKVIEFQIEYSGLELTIFDKPSSTFRARLFSAYEIETNAPIDFFQIDSQYYFYCGNHETAQFWFVISGNGEFCTCNNERESANIVYSSFHKFIETYAFEDILSRQRKYELPAYYDLVDPAGFENFTRDFVYQIATSDDYNKWLSKDDLVIHQGSWLNRPASYIHVYGSGKSQCEIFTQSLKNANIIA